VPGVGVLGNRLRWQVVRRTEAVADHARTTRIATKTRTGNESESAAVFRSEVASDRMDRQSAH
jgi:hypothetical protein